MQSLAQFVTAMVWVAVFVWIAWSIHCRNVLATELPTRLRNSLPICFFPWYLSEAMKKTFDREIHDAIMIRVRVILDCQYDIMDANFHNDFVGRRSAELRLWRAENAFHRLRRALTWYGWPVHSDPAVYPPFDLPAA